MHFFWCSFSVSIQWRQPHWWRSWLEFPIWNQRRLVFVRVFVCSYSRMEKQRRKKRMHFGMKFQVMCVLRVCVHFLCNSKYITTHIYVSMFYFFPMPSIILSRAVGPRARRYWRDYVQKVQGTSAVPSTVCSSSYFQVRSQSSYTCGSPLLEAVGLIYLSLSWEIRLWLNDWRVGSSNPGLTSSTCWSVLGQKTEPLIAPSGADSGTYATRRCVSEWVNEMLLWGVLRYHEGAFKLSISDVLWSSTI